MPEQPKRLTFGMKYFGLLAAFAACNRVPPFHARDAQTECVAETDAAFCARGRAVCDDFTATDNCGESRTAMCGTCNGTGVCVANTCTAPVCSALSFPNHALIDAVNDPNDQDRLSGVSASGETVLWQRSCCGSLLSCTLWIADWDGHSFVPHSLTDVTALEPIGVWELDAVTLTADGLTIIGASEGDDDTKFYQATRTAIGTITFGRASNADFAALDVTPPSRLSNPVISSDGLAFYFRWVGNFDGGKNGLYETVRDSTAVPFPPAKKLPDELQVYKSITGISSDRMTLFVQDNVQVTALTRKSLYAPFTVSNASPIPGFGTRPLGDCQRQIGTYSIGGCAGEDIATFTK